MVAPTTNQNGVAAVAIADSTVSSSTNGNSASSSTTHVSSPPQLAKVPLPKGKYTLVGIDIDTTGRRLIDEIVQLAAYTPKEHFEQYIMPYMNLNPAARQRHQVRVISIGFYRMLKSMQTYKIIKSKSEIAALKDFLDWLEALKAKDPSSQGIVLVYHEERKFIPYMILESLKKYNLLDRFLNTVKSFVNGLNLAKANANDALQHYTLRKLSKVLSASKTNENNNQISSTISTNSESIVGDAVTGGSSPQSQQQQQHDQSPQKNNNNKQNGNVGGGGGGGNNNNSGYQQQDRELFDGNASVRAKLAYEVAMQLSTQECKQPLDINEAMEKLLTALHPYAQPINCDLNELQTQNENLERQNSFRPVFLNYFKTTLYHRVRAVKFRIILAEQGYALPTLNAIWSEKQKQGLVEILQVIEELKPDDKSELADLFDSYFDPAKTTIKPIVKNNNRRRNKRGVRNNNKNEGNVTSRSAGNEQGAGGDKQVNSTLPDSTVKSPSANNNNNGGKPQRGKRNGRSRNNSYKSQSGGNSQSDGGLNSNNNIALAASN